MFLAIFCDSAALCITQIWRPMSLVSDSVLRRYLVGEREQCRRHLQARRLGGVQIDDKMELGLLEDRQIGRLLALENAARIECRPAVCIPTRTGPPDRAGPAEPSISLRRWEASLSSSAKSGEPQRKRAIREGAASSSGSTRTHSGFMPRQHGAAWSASIGQCKPQCPPLHRSLAAGWL